MIPRLNVPLFFILLLAGLLTFACPAMAQRAPISVSVNPRFGFAPLSPRITLTVPRHEDNRSICVALDNDRGYGRISCFTHEGIDAFPQVPIAYGGLPAGQYDIRASLERETLVEVEDGWKTETRIFVAKADFCVLKNVRDGEQGSSIDQCA